MAPSKLISTSQGFQDSKGTVVANGMLMLQLSQTATVTATGGQITTEPIYLNLDSSGKITSTAIWFVDELSPSGLIYYGTVYASNKTRMIPGLEKLQYSITGASFDLATAVQSGSASPSFSGAVLLTPTGNQTITTGNLTLSTGNLVTTSGNISSGGTLSATGATTLSSTLAVTGQATFSSSEKLAEISAPSGAASFSILWADSTDHRLKVKNNNGTAQLVSVGIPTFQQFTSNGTFTIPAGVTGVKVTVVAGGGGGGGGGAAANANGTGAGSGGAAIKFLSGLTPGNTLAVTVGAGGTVSAGANGGNGGTSSVASGTQTITTITTNGGNGGLASTSQIVGGGAAGSGGDMNFAGNPGDFGILANQGGNGGGSIFAGGGTGGLQAAGVAAGAPGAGGGAGGGNSGSNVAGGAGAAGIVIFEWVT